MKKLLTVLSVFALFVLISCDEPAKQSNQTSDSGVERASIKVPTDPATGMTSEQANIAAKTINDSKPGAIKHLYVFSAYSGQCLIYSTVKGKVTSGDKRLSPTSVLGDALHSSEMTSNWVRLHGQDYVTDEVPDEYGTYGHSNPYLYWFDTKGNFHQLYNSGGIFIFISDNPMAVKSVDLNLTLENNK